MSLGVYLSNGVFNLKRKIKKFLVFVSIIGILGSGVYLYFNTDILRISTIEFNENPNIDLYDIQRYSGVKYGTPYFEVNIRETEKALMQHPYIKKVVVEKRFPNTVHFVIEYRTHFFNIRYSDIVLSMDDQMHVLEVLAKENEGFTVEGFAFDSFSTGKLIDISQLYVLENIVRLIKLIEQSNIQPESIITFEARNIVMKVDGIGVKFGIGENIEDKFNAFASIYDALKLDGINTGIIDVSTEGFPVYRPFGE